MRRPWLSMLTAIAIASAVACGADTSDPMVPTPHASDVEDAGATTSTDTERSDVVSEPQSDASIDTWNDAVEPTDSSAVETEDTFVEDAPVEDAPIDIATESDDGAPTPDGAGPVSDWDLDGVEDALDNCPYQSNPGQEDADGDTIGDACEPDSDGDGVIDDEDNCIDGYNPIQEDSNGDGIGDACEPDEDGDGSPDTVDNCPGVFNPEQGDSDGDGIGNLCEPDSDGDTIPDDADPMPDDPDMPGVAADFMAYAHTSSTLYTMDVKNYEVTLVGPFIGASSVTDVAIDSYGVLYAISFSNLYTCHPETAVCTQLGSLPTSFNGLTMVAPGVLDPWLDVLIGISNAGGWYRLDVDAGTVTITQLGSYGAGYSSSGDAYMIDGYGAYAAVNKTGSSADMLVSVDPATGEVLADIGPIDTFSSVYGLAGWSERAFAFDSSGTILQILTGSAMVSVVYEGSQVWWGAGVKTRIGD
jgi:hypothetical protein